MRHAGKDTLDALEPLLERVRAIPGPREKTRGVFYVKGIAFLHFHEDPAGVFADLKSADGWRRMRAVSPRERASVERSAVRAARSFDRRGAR